VVLEIGDQAELSSTRQVANVRITITCSRTFAPGPIRVSVRQGASGGTGRSGSAYKCNGRPQRLLVPVTAGQPFHRGSASASAAANLAAAGSGNGAANVTTNRSLQLV
jgi:hypothetical protein